MKRSVSMKAGEPTCLRRRFQAVRVYLDSRVVLAADARLRSPANHWTPDSRDEAVVDLFLGVRHHALGRSSRVGVPRLVCQSVAHPSFLVHGPREKFLAYLLAIAKLEESGLFGTSHDRRDFSGRRDHHEIRSHPSRDHD
jgi:hypothetical protein